MQEQEAIYSLLVSLQSEVLSRMKEGVVSKELYQSALSYIKEKKPELESHFVKNMGHGVCIRLISGCDFHLMEGFVDGHGIP